MLGGNKSLLFNGEYLIQVAGPVRLVLFYDTGQVRDEGQNFRMSEFVASDGAEVRFFHAGAERAVPPDFHRNINYDGIFNNNLKPEKKKSGSPWVRLLFFIIYINFSQTPQDKHTTQPTTIVRWFHLR